LGNSPSILHDLPLALIFATTSDRTKAGDSRIAPTKTPNAADQHLSADHGGVIAAASRLNMRTLSLNPAHSKQL
jgi:hypothetical protein